MQDRFKFRVWDKVNECFVEDDKTLYLDQLTGNIVYVGFDCGQFYNIEADDMVLEQCTGLKDKTDKLIYEGDIVEYKIPGVPKLTEVVSWFASAAHYCKGAQDLSTYQKSTVIIGNIHENPELIPEHYRTICK